MPVTEIVAQLDAYSRAYRQLLNAAVRLQLQMKAHERSFKRWHELEEEALIHLFTEGVTPHLQDALAVIVKPKLAYEKRIAKLAKQLPVWAWAEKVRGFGANNLGQLIGQTGTLDDYANPAKVWKRMGLAVGEDGKAQRRVAGPGGILQGFSPQRRALMHVIGDCLIKGNKTPDGGDGEYRSLYVERKTYEQARNPDLALIVHHKRAMRYMEKRLLLHLWRAWRVNGATGEMGEP